MQITDTNLWSLNELFGVDTRVPNRISPPSVYHVRRCLKAGLIEVEGGRTGFLALTERGVDTLAAWRAQQ